MIIIHAQIEKIHAHWHKVYFMQVYIIWIFIQHVVPNPWVVSELQPNQFDTLYEVIIIFLL